MNFGLVTSFVVAGILLLSILSMNKNVSESSTELTMRQIMQQRSNDIADLLENDILKVGYKSSDDIPIQTAQIEVFQFKSDIDNDGDEDIVTWEYDDSNEPVLIRRIDSEPEPTVIRSVVTTFKIEYLDSNNDPILDPESAKDQIRHFKISMVLTSPEPVGGIGSSTPEYITTRWERRFTPINLTL